MGGRGSRCGYLAFTARSSCGAISGFRGKSCERSLRWSDPEVGITWPLERLAGMAPLLAEKDAAAPTLAEAVAAGEVFA